ncbi:MAG: glycosyltransferase family 2 protein [Methylococcales bacterium]|nr:glycosyltransferase family 2 protein [Methylococcales bacterium]
MKICVIIPVYNHKDAIKRVVERLKPLNLPLILVNDGSSEPCSGVLQQIARQQSDWVTLHERKCNGGKGAAVTDGMLLAIKNGYSHAIQVDADGQHNIEDITRFVEASKQYPERMILGQPKFDDSVPKKRLYGRKITNLWIWINTLSFAIADGMCGFRCYPLAAIDKLLSSVTLGQGMDFDIDIVVRLYWQGVNTVNLLTKVQYPTDGVSHFKMWQDNLLISKIHTVLFFGMLLRFPKLLVRSRP